MIGTSEWTSEVDCEGGRKVEEVMLAEMGWLQEDEEEEEDRRFCLLCLMKDGSF